MNGPLLERSGRRLEWSRQDRLCQRVWSEIILARDAEDIGKLGAGPINPAFDRAHRDIANGRRLFIGKTRRGDEKERFALLGRQLGKSRVHVVHVKLAELVGRNTKVAAESAIHVSDLPASLAHPRIELIPKDSVEPGSQIRARLKSSMVGPCLQQCLLNEIVGAIISAG